MEDKEKELIEILKNIDEKDLFYIWNDYCQKNQYYDDEIFYLEDFDDLMSNKKPLEIIESIDASEFSAYEKYFKFDIYGAKTFDYLSDYIDFDYLADYVIRNNEDFDNDEIKEFLENCEE